MSFITYGNEFINLFHGWIFKLLYVDKVTLEVFMSRPMGLPLLTQAHENTYTFISKKEEKKFNTDI